MFLFLNTFLRMLDEVKRDDCKGLTMPAWPMQLGSMGMAYGNAGLKDSEQRID